VFSLIERSALSQECESLYTVTRRVRRN
jgi:hypothetical protein